jgi:glycosyltransferase involved in cell wall biosynthesis
MNLLLNLGPLKIGGGQNVGINFLNNLPEKKYYNNLFLIVAKNSQIESIAKKRKLSFYSVSNNPILRVFTELFILPSIIKKNKVNIIYTLFGFGFFPKSIPQVIGSADSNIYYPEIDFWNQHKNLNKFKKLVIDKIRIFGIKRATAVIFENKSMLKRGSKLYNISKSIYIPPSISDYEITTNETNSSNSINLLFLCGWQKNKNYQIIPNLLKQSKVLNVDIHVFFTAKEDFSKEHKEFISNIRKENVEKNITMTGQINKEQLSNLYSKINYVMLLSLLESFSNNIIESWFFKKPLVISDLEWSKSICDNAAIYVDRNDVNDILNKIIVNAKNKNNLNLSIKNGSLKMKSLPTIKEKVKLELKYIKNIYENTN